MEELIVSLLKENGRIIIPDFGAFIVKTKSPFKAIFNEFLQYNDGSLIGALADKENIEREEATKRVKDYATDLSNRLNKEENITIQGVGILTKNATGKINLLEEGADLTTPAEEKTTSSKPESTVEFDTPAESKKPEDTPKEEKEEKEPSPVVSKEKPVTKPVDEPVKRPTPTPPPPVVKKEEKKEPTPIEEYYNEGNSKRTMQYILWGIVIVLVNGAIIGYFLFDDQIKAMFGKNDGQIENVIETPSIDEEDAILIVEDTTPKQSNESVIIDETDDEQSSQAETVPTSTSDFTGKKYYVVAGVFREEENADNLVSTLQSKGYNAEKFGKIGALHAVSYDVFQTKREADQFMLKIKSEVDSEAWIKVID